MGKIYLAIVAIVFAYVPAAVAATGYVADQSAKGLIVWRSIEGYRSCKDEREATGSPGRICFAAAAAMVENCTKASYRGAGPGLIMGSAFVKVQLLDGDHAGTEGLVFAEHWKEGDASACSAPRPAEKPPYPSRPSRKKK